MSLPLAFNWIDLVVFIIFVRIIYIATKKGFVAEFFKITATFLALFFSFHLYTAVADFLVKHLSFLGKDLGTLLPFVIIYFLVWLLISYIRKIAMLLFKVEPHALIERWFCLFIGFLRAALFTSILFFMLHLLSISYLDKSLEGSASYALLKYASPKSYEIMGRCYKKIFPDFVINEKVGETYETKESS